MTIGTILYHPVHGKIYVTRKAYSPVENAVVWYATDSIGKERPLDGTETKHEEKEEKEKEDSAKKAHKKTLDDATLLTANLLKDVREKLERGILVENPFDDNAIRDEITAVKTAIEKIKTTINEKADNADEVVAKVLFALINVNLSPWLPLRATTLPSATVSPALLIPIP